MRNVELITTGGTIEKTYDEALGRLTNARSIVARMLSRLRLESTRVHVRELMSKDSLDLTDDDRALIVRAVRSAAGLSDAVVILHGTDTLTVTGECILRDVPDIRVPVVLTGAMRPFEMKRSDALQNLTEALLASSFIAPGVYVAGHGRVLPFPGVVKDRKRQTFVRADEVEA
ncbi:MAG: asparaginase [Phycisphaeraceae bacterium]|nr:asparaginase [Phycisphaerales bacterium]MCB9843914.1 asparaginase [Phycisphaeraceae bacterium]